MTPFGIRKKLKSAIKGAMGMEAPSAPIRSAPHSPPKTTVSAQLKNQSEPRQPAPTVAKASEAVAAQPEPEPASSRSALEIPNAIADQDTNSSAENQTTNADAALADGMELTTENVQEVLDDYVRPGLQSDGGDITLIKIEDDNIYVQLVGACSTCPSSIATMKMGVEMLLKEEFPALNEVVDVTALSPEELDALSETA